VDVAEAVSVKALKDERTLIDFSFVIKWEPP